MSTNNGILYVISGPSGAGKGTVCKELLSKRDDIFVSVSATTRNKRPSEEEGINYFYKTDDEFSQMIADGEILEWSEYNGSLYAVVLAAMGFGSYYPQELIKVDEVTYMTELYHDEADDIVGTAYFRWTGDHWILQEMG